LHHEDVSNPDIAMLVMDGKRVTGVTEIYKGKAQKIPATREIILSAGAYQSPQLLMLSGIGDPAELARHSFACQHALKGLGKNLQDHIGSFVQHRCTKPIAYFNMTKPLQLAFAALQYVFTRNGLLAIFSLNPMAFLKNDPALERPDMQHYLLPAATSSIARTLCCCMTSAGWDATSNLAVPLNIKLIFLPTRAPAVNPVENIWQYMRAN
jgi:choline dehydrogenase-like flavoprotein